MLDLFTIVETETKGRRAMGLGRWTSPVMSHRIAKIIQRLSGTTPCPEIRWPDVVRVEAMGTDAFSAFQIWLTFTHFDGTQAEVTIETRGYWDIVDSLHTRFPSISPTWYEEMADQPWHVEKILYSPIRHGRRPARADQS